jgi:hypothetical protein
MTDFTEKVRRARITRIHGAIKRASDYLGTHSNAATATVLIRDLKEKLTEAVTELELTATGESK